MHTLIFDIGKTNKKAFVFDKNYQEVFKDYSRFEELKDNSGFPCDDLFAIQSWLESVLVNVLERYDISSINFSTYGASFVHLDKDGKVLTPLYNYMKPISKDILTSFYEKYGSIAKLVQETASPSFNNMLNAGLQLYWLKYEQPSLFKQIRWSLHFPQYLSYLLTGIPVSEFTSIGCHTMLWNFEKNDYHDWVYAEEIDKVLPPIVPTNTSINCQKHHKKFRVGVGIHDSSSALLPYFLSDKKPFLLVSTGTWSIALNPYNKELLTREELESDCLNFMRIDGFPVKAARLFLGQEYKIQVKYLQDYFNAPKDKHKTITFDDVIYDKVMADDNNYFAFRHVNRTQQQPKHNQLEQFANFETAYHCLMKELVLLQVEAINLAVGNTKINKIYIDGGFADNEIYVQMLARHFRHFKIRTTRSPLGSALGAAIVTSDKEIHKKFLKNRYSLQKVFVQPN